MKRIIWITVAVLCIAVCIASGSFLLRYYLGLRRTEQLIQSVRIEPAESARPQQAAPRYGHRSGRFVPGGPRAVGCA